MHQPRTIFDAMEKHRRTLDLMTGRDSPLIWMEQNRRTLDLMTGRDSPLIWMEQNRRTLDLMTGRNSVLKMIEQSRKLLDSMAGRASFAWMLGANRTFAQIAGQPYFASMVGTAAMPRPAWAALFDDLREGIDADLYDGALSAFNTAAELAGEDDAGTWWVDRLPLTVQLALLVLALEVLDTMSEFMADLSGDDLPPAYRSGTQVLFSLVVVILAVIDAKAKAVSDDDSDDDVSG